MVGRKVDPGQSRGKIHLSADKLNAFEKHEFTVFSIFQDDQGGLKIKQGKVKRSDNTFLSYFRGMTKQSFLVALSL